VNVNNLLSDDQSHIITPVQAPVLDYSSVDVGPVPAVKPMFGRMLVLLPPLTAMTAWPVLIYTLFMFGFLLAVVIMLACAKWAWTTSDRVATWRYALKLEVARRGDAVYPPPNYLQKLRRLLFVAQLVGVLGSFPLAGLILKVLQRAGVYLGWS
jgi:hypothetical protein